MNLRRRLTVLQGRIDELTLRERASLFIVVSILLYVVWNTLLMSPQEVSQKQLLAETTRIRAEISQLEQQKLDIINRASDDPNAADLRQLQQLREATHQVEGQIRQAVDGLIEPREMARALESVLKGQPQLSFVRIENLGAKPLIEVDPKATADGASAGIYKHTMRIELEGSFQQAHDYLQALEQLPWRLHWESVELEMLNYPRARVVITVNTLSLSEGWIGV